MGKQTKQTASVPLPVLNEDGGKPARRRSRMGPRRAAVLILLHVAILAHVAHWLLAGESVSPLEPSESMYTLSEGELNAGFVLFSLAILLTLLLGRFFCGWACHVVALQDLCSWMLKKIGLRPKPFRSRLLLWFPLALALYMFVWPSFKRVALAPAFEAWWPQGLAYIGAVPTWSSLENHFVVDDFWSTFPSLWVAIPFFGVCGFLIIYLLGSKGYCTYACPYGGFFAPIDKASPGRIVVDHDKCDSTGHCTASCSSNVRVHEEIKDFGMVVNPGCMKCMDCVSVCPNDALSYKMTLPPLLKTNPHPDKAKAEPARRFTPKRVALGAALLAFSVAAAVGLFSTLPPLGATVSLLAMLGLMGVIALQVWSPKPPPAEKGASPKFDLSRGEEVALAVLFGLIFVSLRGLYGVFPMLFAGGIAACAVFLFWKGFRLLRDRNVRLHRFQFKRDGRVRPAGYALLGACAVGLALLGHSAVLSWNWAAGDVAFQRANFAASNGAAHGGRFEGSAQDWAETALERYRRVGGFAQGGLAPTITPKVEHRVAILSAMLERPDEAEAAFRRIIDRQGPADGLCADLAQTLRSQGRHDDADAYLASVVEQRPGFAICRDALAQRRLRQERPADAVALYEAGVELNPDDDQMLVKLARARMASGDAAGAAGALEAALEARPDATGYRQDYAIALFYTGRAQRAVDQMVRAAENDPAQAADRFRIAADMARQAGMTDRARDLARRAAQAADDARAGAPGA